MMYFFDSKKNILVLFSIFLFGISSYFLAKGMYFSSFSVFLFCVIFFLSFRYLIQKEKTEIHQLINSILVKDFSVQFVHNEKKTTQKMLLEVYQQQKEQNYDTILYKNIFENIINQLNVGIIILEKEKSQEFPWNVFFINQTFLSLFELPKYNSWSYYQNKIPEFYSFLEDIKYQSGIYTLTITIENKGTFTYSLKCNTWKNNEKMYFILSMDSIKNIIEQKEKETWIDILKIQSHEIRTTISPVYSLIQNLIYLEQQNFTKQVQEEFRLSLETISTKVQNLVLFLDNYRLLAEMPTPIKNVNSIKRVIQGVKNLIKNEFKEHKIHFETQIEEHQLEIDEKMIERLLLNLFSNSIHSLKGKANKKIWIEIKLKENQSVWRIYDNGKVVPKEFYQRIFIPFFSTKKQGTGIGLTLSRNIAEAHGGTLSYIPSSQFTCFELVIPFLR
ncbi:MAG: HAMP domain-containing histidine kinase [Flavobacteriales bacterium]|nr:HAMP domain-containing histidine kinase [Flavobacteriales bacterium]